LQRFFDELGERKQSIRAVSIDMSGGYEKAIRESIPDAEVCFDPFVRHEALLVRAGCETPLLARRSALVKLRAARSRSRGERREQP